MGQSFTVRPPARWVLPANSNGSAQRLCRELGVSQLLANILEARGYSDPAEARRYLWPELDGLHDPFAMADMDLAVKRLTAAIDANEQILIYGDYDVDGTASVVVLKKVVELLGGRADFHIPHRLRDGYGMRSDVVDAAAQSGVRLIISVDTGIRAKTVVERARELGIDVIITDHHLPEAELPPAIAVLNPNRLDCCYPCKQLSGAGVTLKLVQALLTRSSMDETRQRVLLDSFLKLVAVATVADIVPLTGENRVIVRRGLSGLRKVRNPGLRALLQVSGLTDGTAPTAHQVAFRLAPRINAAGRMATASDVIQLFLTQDEAEAQTIAQNLDLLNRERQTVEHEIVETILKQCEIRSDQAERAALVFAAPGWHVGVLGIVASRLTERLCRPVFVLSTAAPSANGTVHWTGSGRSIPAFHLLEALESMPELFERFGGHRGAAGLTLRDEHLGAFRERFHQFAANCLSEEERRPEYRADAAASLDVFDTKLAEELAQMGPFGFGNPAPLLFVRNAEVAGAPRTMSDGKHLSIPFRNEGRVHWIKAWHFGEQLSKFSSGSRHDLLVQIEDDDFSRRQGYEGWCLTAKDMRQADAT